MARHLLHEACLLAALIPTRWPKTRVRVIHRICELTSAEARCLHGEAVTRAIRSGGITDVHTTWCCRRQQGPWSST